MSKHHKRRERDRGDWIVGLTVIASLLGLFALIIFSKPTEGQNNQTTSDSFLSADEANFDFGTISMAKGKVSKLYKIKNPTDGPITINRISTSCMCTKATLVRGDKKEGPFSMPSHGGYAPKINQVMAPGEEAQIEAVFDPAAHGPAGVGPVDRKVFVDSSDNKRLILGFKANVTP
jgi:hypothetical protein